jgi:hypothetical protein
MKTLYALAVGLLILFSGTAHAQSRSHAAKPLVTTEVRAAARKLAHAWVETASAQTLDQLANRSMAFAGMVPDLLVVLDGHRFSATQVLNDSALTILRNNTTEADAAAARNTVYTLMEIAEGRVTHSHR